MNTPPRSFLAPPPSSPAADDKAALRGRMRAVRRELKLDLPDAADRAAAHLSEAFALGRLPTPRVAAIYHAQGSELDAWPLAAVLRGLGAAVVLPVTVQAQAPLVFRQARDGDLFAPDAAGVPAPASGLAFRPDLVVAPVLAFDRAGGRLGQGGGFYDRTLVALRADGAPVLALGLAYAGQEVDGVAVEAHDARVDGVLTERGLTLFNHDG